MRFIAMDSQEIVSKINTYLHNAANDLVDWLQGILPRIADSWWNDCVLSSLSYSQREIAENKGYSKLSDFDLAALLRIANKSWYDMRTVTQLPNYEREVIREMINVRNNWAHCSAELPGKDIIIQDLNTIIAFLEQIGGNKNEITEVRQFLTHIENPTFLARKAEARSAAPESSVDTQLTKTDTDVSVIERNTISVNSLVYLVGSPETKGIVVSINTSGPIIRYEVFVDNALRSFYEGQIRLVETTSKYVWASIDQARSFLTAYQINNPSSRDLYSLNSARIDFVPYQFRPALKMIHADEPRILIADSVGVGKTIEAGLIIKELEARIDLERVLIICPRPLVAERKWELEMKRFDEEFIPLDGTTLRQIISDTDRDGDWPGRYNKVIIPYSILDSRVFLGDDTKITHCFGLTDLDPEPHFDLVIVDEAHHIRNGSDEKEKAFAYKCTKYFCDHADAVIMLTATPLQTGDNDLFTLLNVLRPDIIIDQKTFAMMSRPNTYISQAVRLTRAAQPGWEERTIQELRNITKTQWGENVIAENPLYDDILIRLEKPNITREDRVRLISDIESLHSFNTILNRTRRRDIQDFCVRRSHTVSTEFTEFQRRLHDELLAFERQALSILHDPRTVPFLMSTMRRQAASCIFGLAPCIRDIVERRFQQMNDDPDIDYSTIQLDEKSMHALSSTARNLLSLADTLPEDDPKFDSTLEIIMQKQHMQNNKVMLFSTFRNTLSYLKKKLLMNGIRTEQIDGSVKDEDRYLLKSRFELPKENQDAIDVLLFSEVGSEGLDYQFCDLMINYDLPWNPMRIEQRIGRIDRRGQLSEAVNIYNVITEGTVDAEIYYRCLLRIGIFERNIGDCEEILGSVANGIESLMLNATLTNEERERKLEQLADNEIRKIQELNKLEEAEKDLFGFDLTEFTTSQEIRKAENPWLTQQNLQRLIENYCNERIGSGAYIIGDSARKTLRLSATARGILRDDLRKLPGSRNALRRAWEQFLAGKKPTLSVTFDPETASKDRDINFLTSMHPLAKQAAAYYSSNSELHLNLHTYSNTIPDGNYLFSVYAWKYVGVKTYTRLVTICENDLISHELPDMLENAEIIPDKKASDYDWSPLESIQMIKWQKAREKHRRDANSLLNYKLESLGNSKRNRVRSLEQQIQDALDDSIKRMYMSLLENSIESYAKKEKELTEKAAQADIFTTLLINGRISVHKE